jgi:hypothetical protein
MPAPLFIVNQPWLRPAKSGQSTEMYMNLTSTDGATLVAVRSDEAAAIVIRGPAGRAHASTCAAAGEDPCCTRPRQDPPGRDQARAP